MQQLMEGLEEAVAAGVSRAFLPPSCDIGVITQEDHQWEQCIISNVTLFLEQKKYNLWRRKGYLNGVPLQRWEAGSLSAVPAVPLLNFELQEPLALQEDCRSPFASRSLMVAVAVSAALDSHAECVLLSSTLNFSIFQLVLVSRVLTRLKLGKHMTQKNDLKSWRKALKQELLSLNILSERNFLYVIMPRGKGKCWIMLQTWEFVTFCHGHFMAPFPSSVNQNLL